MQQFPRCLCVVVLWSLVSLAAPAEAQAEARTIRIRLLEQHHPRTIVVQAHGGGLALYTGTFDQPVLRLKRDEQIILTLRETEVQAETPAGTLYADALRLVAEHEFSLDISEGQKTLKEARRYPGSLAVIADPARSSTLRLINHLDLETYVANVVAREYGFDDLEGSKAMAVLARTYALRTAGKYGADYDHVDHVMSQAYEGTAHLTPTALAAAQQTRGQVLTYSGELIEATYFSSSGGHTADNEAVWRSKPVPYLRGRPDPYDSASPHSTWRSEIDRGKLLKILSRAYGFTVQGFQVAEQGADGRAHSIELLGKGGRRRTIPGNDFRLLATQHFGVSSLRSTRFEAQREGSRYVFEGSGFGHGVGLSQYGALAMSRQGHSYEEILAFYYSGVALQPLDDVGSAPALPLARSEPVYQEPPPPTPRPAVRLNGSSATPVKRTGW